MIELERRLQHAARELREVQIEAPPLPTLAAPRRPSGITGRVPTLVMPVLFVLGGLAVVAGGIGRQPEPAPKATSAAPAAVEVAAIAGDDDLAVPTLTAHQEIALIASLAPAPTPTSAQPATDARSFSRYYR